MRNRKICSLSFALVVALACSSSQITVNGQTSTQLESGKDEGSSRGEKAYGSDSLLPSNVYASDIMIPVLTDMLKRSATFRRQCSKIEEANNIQLTVQLVPTLRHSRYRALSIVTKYKNGFTSIRILIPAARNNHAELIGHEFEHAIEQAEGLDLKTLSLSRDKQVYLLEDGTYETARARKAGNLVDSEFRSYRPPPVDLLSAEEAESKK